MSRLAKICFLVALVLLVVSWVLQIITGMWVNLNTVLMAAAAAAAGAAVVMDWKLYLEFFTMRTTKHGMNMGALILMALVTVVCLNYLANKHNRTLDLTQEKINSLSDQTVKVLNGLKNDLEIKVFYKGNRGKQGDRIEEKKSAIRQQANMFKDASGKVKVGFINAYIEQEKAIRYLSDQPDRDVAAVMAFVEYGSKKIRVDEPFEESTLTSAIIKATREGDAKIYFVKGHGEKDVNSDDDQGLREFSRALEQASFKVEPLDLIDKKEIPADAAVVAIVGPSVPYLDSELQWLRDYARRGGRLFIAGDPGQRHNLPNLVKPLGVEFQNNYVVTMHPQLLGQGQATVLGRSFDPMSEITRSIPDGSGFAIFPLVSEVKPAPDKISEITVTEIVKSDKAAFTVNDLTRPPEGKPDLKPVTVAVDVRGKIAKLEDKKSEDKKADDDGKTFEAVVFGDSDFISNRALMAGVNRDLAMNAIARLANQNDLISIRPKVAKGNQIVMTRYQNLVMVIGMICIPIALLIASSVMWFRRRGA